MREDVAFAWIAEVLADHGVTDPAVLEALQERAIAEHRRLIDHEARLRALVEAAFSGLLVAVDATVVWVNEGGAALMGGPVQALLGRPFASLMTQDSLQRVAQRIATGSREPYEIEALRLDGTPIPLEVTGVPITWDGRAARLTAVRDIRDRREAEARLRAGDRRYRELADMIPAALLEISAEGEVGFVNRTALSMFGCGEVDALTGRAAVELVVPEERARFREDLERRLRGESAAEGEYRLLRADGGRFFGLVHTSRQTEGERVIGLRTAVLDVSEQRRAQEAERALERRMRQSQKLESLGALAGGIAHDFNNLLVGILGSAELLRLDLAPDAPTVAAVERIRNSARAASELTQQMVLYAGRGAPERAAVSLDAVVADVEQVLRLGLPAAVRLEVQVEPALPSVDGDADQLRQMVQHLVTNAVDALGEGGGRITIELDATEPAPAELVRLGPELDATAERFVRLRVGDDGVGMDASTLDRIYDPFFSTKRAGRGLGLAAVHGIVRGHGGAVDVRSRPGEGTRFTVVLPARRSTTPPPASGAARTPPDAPRLVLVIDDDEVVRAVARAMLARLGFEVLLAGGAAEGLALVERERSRIRLVLLDLTMPEVDGRETFTRLHALAPELPVVLWSGYDEAGATRNLDGLAGFLQKPFTLDALAAALASALGPEAGASG